MDWKSIIEQIIESADFCEAREVGLYPTEIECPVGIDKIQFVNDLCVAFYEHAPKDFWGWCLDLQFVVNRHGKICFVLER